MDEWSVDMLLHQSTESTGTLTDDTIMRRKSGITTNSNMGASSMEVNMGGKSKTTVGTKANSDNAT